MSDELMNRNITVYNNTRIRNQFEQGIGGRNNGISRTEFNSLRELPGASRDTRTSRVDFVLQQLSAAREPAQELKILLNSVRPGANDQNYSKNMANALLRAGLRDDAVVQIICDFLANPDSEKQRLLQNLLTAADQTVAREFINGLLGKIKSNTFLRGNLPAAELTIALFKLCPAQTGQILENLYKDAGWYDFQRSVDKRQNIINIFLRELPRAVDVSGGSPASLEYQRLNNFINSYNTEYYPHLNKSNSAKANNIGFFLQNLREAAAKGEAEFAGVWQSCSQSMILKILDNRELLLECLSIGRDYPMDRLYNNIRGSMIYEQQQSRFYNSDIFKQLCVNALSLTDDSWRKSCCLFLVSAPDFRSQFLLNNPENQEIFRQMLGRSGDLQLSNGLGLDSKEKIYIFLRGIFDTEADKELLWRNVLGIKDDVAELVKLYEEFGYEDPEQKASETVTSLLARAEEVERLAQDCRNLNPPIRYPERFDSIELLRRIVDLRQKPLDPAKPTALIIANQSDYNGAFTAGNFSRMVEELLADGHDYQICYYEVEDDGESIRQAFENTYRCNPQSAEYPAEPLQHPIDFIVWAAHGNPTVMNFNSNKLQNEYAGLSLADKDKIRQGDVAAEATQRIASQQDSAYLTRSDALKLAGLVDFCAPDGIILNDSCLTGQGVVSLADFLAGLFPGLKVISDTVVTSGASGKLVFNNKGRVSGFQFGNFVYKTGRLADMENLLNQAYSSPLISRFFPLYYHLFIKETTHEASDKIVTVAADKSEKITDLTVLPQYIKNYAAAEEHYVVSADIQESGLQMLNALGFRFLRSGAEIRLTADRGIIEAEFGEKLTDIPFSENVQEIRFVQRNNYMEVRAIYKSEYNLPDYVMIVYPQSADDPIISRRLPGRFYLPMTRSRFNELRETSRNSREEDYPARTVYIQRLLEAAQLDGRSRTTETLLILLRTMRPDGADDGYTQNMANALARVALTERGVSGQVIRSFLAATTENILPERAVFLRHLDPRLLAELRAKKLLA
ncbi:MAG: hypothetical protein LBQ83_00095 [Candidatus Margulisbacteria bacterium]|jgi:hypothetical protein|nr:hypothetical protein [Candidatus Margulisiibacteriota bacterium]